MTEEIKEVGELFKTRRKELSFSLKEVENATSIRTNHLEAIEEGREDEFLSPVYLLGFMRQYASFLELDGEKIIRDHPDAFKNRVEPHEFSYGIGTLEVRGSMGGGVKWLPNLIWAALSVALIVLAYYLSKYLGVI
ncbi:MAG: hypothetical protein K1060chlam2_01291 [Chlamydiae bacterium]|nr:hypothetical protein [Chlamydiota bacterium]